MIKKFWFRLAYSLADLSTKCMHTVICIVLTITRDVPETSDGDVTTKICINSSLKKNISPLEMHLPHQWNDTLLQQQTTHFIPRNKTLSIHLHLLFDFYSRQSTRSRKYVWYSLTVSTPELTLCQWLLTWSNAIIHWPRLFREHETHEAHTCMWTVTI